MASTLKDSLSTSAREGGGKAVLKKIVFQPIYTHNFAMELYKKFHKTGVITDESLQICQSSIQSLFLLSLDDSTVNPETKMEIYSTAILARAFDRFFSRMIYSRKVLFFTNFVQESSLNLVVERHLIYTFLQHKIVVLTKHYWLVIGKNLNLKLLA